MNRKMQADVARGLVVVGMLVFAGMLYLGYVFPRQLAIWAERDVPLSGVQLWLADLSIMCKAHGFFIIPALLLGIAACGAWDSTVRPPDS